MTKNQYLKGFSMVVLVLALVRCLFPSVAGDLVDGGERQTIADSIAKESVAVSPSPKRMSEEDKRSPLPRNERDSLPFDASRWHPVMGVLSYDKAFPDSNDVQLSAALTLGVKEVHDRDEAETRKGELVYVGASPYYHVDRLKSSIPYLVPRAAVLLQDIGRNFFDSLYVKHIPLHQPIVTSILRSRADLERLKEVNHNVSDNSCHLYGTTFDIGYNRYKTVCDPDGPELRAVRDDTLKWVLSEVLRDLREQGRCYVKYEVKQGCFHITTR